MAVPTIISITPSTGTSAGRDLVRIVGTGFAVIEGDPAVSVTIGGVEADVVSGNATHVYALTGAYALASGAASAALAVVIQNLDADGDPVVGETATLAAGFTVQRLDVVDESPLMRLTMRLGEILTEQFTQAGRDVHVDYDDSPADGVRAIPVAQVPSISIAGPVIRFTGWYTSHDRRGVSLGGGDYEIRNPSAAHDLEFSLIMVASTRAMMLNMVSVLAQWRARNRWIEMADEAGSTTMIRWPVDMGEIQISGSGPDNLRTASVSLTVRGFELDGGLPAGKTRLVEDVAVATGRVED